MGIMRLRITLFTFEFSFLEMLICTTLVEIGLYVFYKLGGSKE